MALHARDKHKEVTIVPTEQGLSRHPCCQATSMVPCNKLHLVSVMRSCFCILQGVLMACRRWTPLFRKDGKEVGLLLLSLELLFSA